MTAFDMKRPCLNCPFRTDETAIRFAARERAEEIEETAYRYGFPCHTTAELIEDDEGSSTFVFGDRSQHCVGYAIMRLKAGDCHGWPGIGNDEDLAARLSERVDFDAPVFDSEEDFFAANTTRRNYE